jgi:uncharacterized protein YbbK (DUF523 family)
MDKKPIILQNKPVIGISACCMSCPVRYNGRGFDMLRHIGREKGDFTWVPVCPECLAGLGIMRDPIHISGENGAAVWRGEASIRSRGGRDVTEKLLDGARDAKECLERAGVRAFIYMDGSPSCGVYRTTLKKQSRGHPPGVFGAILDQAGYFLIPALDLQSPLKWWDWRRRLLAYLWLSEVPIATRGDLYDVWYRLKFICQELNDVWARDKGRELAQLDHGFDPAYVALFRREVSDLLRRPSTTKRLTNGLLKNYAYYRKEAGQSLDSITPIDARRNVTTIARELTILERAAAEVGRFVGTAPVLYAGRLPGSGRAKLNMIRNWSDD